MSIRVALIGVGNVASALVQGVELYKKHPERTIGVLPQILQYPLTEVVFALAFDVDADKVGKDLSEAIFAGPNNTLTVHQPPHLDAPVLMGPILDGLESDIRHHVQVRENRSAADVAHALRTRDVDVVVILVPTGANEAAEFYANAALEAGCGVINGMPASIANNAELVAKARRLRLPMVGDDVKSQIGATIIHRLLANLFPARGAVLDRTIQLDWGGDMDFCNLVSNDRYEKGKRQSKTESVIANLPNRDQVECRISAVEYIPFLKNQKEAYTRLEGRIFGGVPVRIDITMQVVDGYNSAGMLADAIRVTKIAMDRGVAGPIDAACSYFSKRPPVQLEDFAARENLLAFVESGIGQWKS